MIEPPWTVMSPMRAAGLPPISTVADPGSNASGGPTQVATSPAQAAGMPPIRTLAAVPISGPPTWGTTPVTSGQT